MTGRLDPEQIHASYKGHQPFLFNADDGPLTGALGHWVECECGYITAGWRTSTGALRAWKFHYDKALQPSLLVNAHSGSNKSTQRSKP